MNGLRTIIVDDEPLAVERLQILCAAEPAIELVGTAADGAAALRLAQTLTPDLILLDIGMPKMDGISVARAIALMQRKPAIIFVTAYDNFAVEAFDLDVVDYMLKPVSAERLNRAIARAQQQSDDGGEIEAARPADEPADAGEYASEFWVSHRSELIRIAALDIERIEAERDYMRLHTGGRSYLLHQTISTLEQRLDPQRFQRIHRSHIIRRDLINGLRHEGGGVWHALLQDGESMRIGRKYLADVKKLAGK
ncbi:MAG: response regulator transcription factor [Sphingomonadales bacterium]|jgi:two-component system response regulator AlgR|nr:response regulator transcription factor [Sphingomonadales bacterium]MBK9004481.1 response regulator transcription factor [Sphingomonadales bacterium]MBK9269667.1 response regulator transcription factor [Sphingomonadales bacterium]MBP6434241.1 response regulator transcription factor [Sphingorhabdus sp.]